MANRARTLDKEVFSIADLREKASSVLPREIRAPEFFNEGAMDLITLKDNEEAYNRYKIRPRILRDVSNLDTSTIILGTKVTFPFGFSPTAAHRLAHTDGELATSRAAAAAGIGMALSTYSTVVLEDVIAQSKGNPYFFQISMMKNRDINRNMLQRAEKAGFKACLLTVDAPSLGRRLNEFRNNFDLPKGVEYQNILTYPGYSALAPGGDEMAYDDALTWPDTIAWMRANTKMEVWLKGGASPLFHVLKKIKTLLTQAVYTPDDVALAVQYGLDGVVISNHGGRQLDGVPATLDALRDCAPVAKGRIKIAVDGGIRRGTDIFKALALGADYCMAGRIPLWGLAYKGQEGVTLAINLLHDEFKLAMALAGCKSVSEINKGHLSVLQSGGVLAKL
ncbi:fmn-dependent dehydrogenase family protein [Ophiostoma piceae UAMH 11346]|uniref:Fmn-dependent dehydrogenase family protein n=1 Tax=Ophiostoma piceae (strain UAMH 11346) TaxID=1262450 RepID=S3BZ35_OPHP1|nr:fmn-dependent dehydrogenase family protein [Ophiostoma piceae UAMH 11346]